MQFASKLTIAAGLLMCGLMGSAQGQETVTDPQLFGNHYTQGNANQATAQMYIAPQPVPAWVGHTYYTYQPLYPHELMVPHKHRYHNYYDNGRGLNRTGVHYRVSAASRFHNAIKYYSLPRW